jgi:hypothetical protein
MIYFRGNEMSATHLAIRESFELLHRDTPASLRRFILDVFLAAHVLCW